MKVYPPLQKANRPQRGSNKQAKLILFLFDSPNIVKYG